MNQIEISTSGLTLEDVVAVARFGAQITISDAAITAMDATRKHIEELANAKEPVYGISTSFSSAAHSASRPGAIAKIANTLACRRHGRPG